MYSIAHICFSNYDSASSSADGCSKVG
jgi:hypothetical protein